MKAERWSRGIVLLFLKPRRQIGVDGQGHASAALPPVKRPGTHCIGGWVGPRAGLDGCGKSRPQRDSSYRDPHSLLLTEDILLLILKNTISNFPFHMRFKAFVSIKLLSLFFWTVTQRWFVKNDVSGLPVDTIISCGKSRMTPE
jgi:hypothetical protein